MNSNTHQQILDELHSEFLDKAFMSEDRFLIPADEAVVFIHRGLEVGLRLAGVEGYALLHTGCVKYLPDYSNDMEDGEVCYEEFVVNTIDRIQAGGSEDIFYDVIFDMATGSNR